MAKERSTRGRPRNGRKEAPEPEVPSPETPSPETPRSEVSREARADSKNARADSRTEAPAADAPARAPKTPDADAPNERPFDSWESFPVETLPAPGSAHAGRKDDPSKDFKYLSSFQRDGESVAPEAERAEGTESSAPPAPPESAPPEPAPPVAAPAQPAIVFPPEAALHRTAGDREAEAEEEGSDFLCFSIAGEEYAIDIQRVWEIIRPRAVTEIPGVPEFISGIISLRGEIVPVLDLRRRLGFPAAEGTFPGAKIVVAIHDGRRVGLAVDAVSHKIRVLASQVSQPPVLLGARESGFLEGVCRHQGRLIGILDPDVVLGFGIGADGAPEIHREATVDSEKDRGGAGGAA